MTSTLRTLLDRVEQGEGADREIDALLDVAFNLRPGCYAQDRGPLIARRDGYVDVGKSGPSWCSPLHTSSIDAAVSLAEKVLPEREPLDVLSMAVEHLTLNGFYETKARGPQICRAVIAIILRDKIEDEALLRAKIAQEERT